MICAQIDREERYQSLAKKYPPAIKRWCDTFSNRRAVDHDGAIVFEATGQLNDITKLYASMVDEAKSGTLKPGDVAEARWVGPKFGRFFGAQDGEDQDGNRGWSGMGPRPYAKELRGETSFLMKNLEEAREELQKSGLKEALEERMIGVKKKRRRTLSEHDGDWDLDRKFDISPFFTTITTRKEFPYLEFIFPVAVNCGSSAKEIALFGARSLALAEIFEKSGYRVALTAESWLAGNLMAGNETKAVMEQIKCPGRSVKSVERIIMRGADEYGDIASFSAASGPEFFRRICFLCLGMGHHLHALEDKLKTSVDQALGHALSARPIPTEPGQIVLTHDVMSQLFSTNKETREKIFANRVLHTISSEQAKAHQAEKAS